jgi:hypothetical protein
MREGCERDGCEGVSDVTYRAHMTFIVHRALASVLPKLWREVRFFPV